MSGFATTVYNVVCRRTSTFALVLIGGTFFFERGFDVATRSIFDSINRGYRVHHFFFAPIPYSESEVFFGTNNGRTSNTNMSNNNGSNGSVCIQ